MSIGQNSDTQSHGHSDSHSDSHSPSQSNTSSHPHCCHSSTNSDSQNPNEANRRPIDKLYWFGISYLTIALIIFIIFSSTDITEPVWLKTIADTAMEMVSTMWFAMVMAIFFVGVIGHIPRDLILSIIGRGKTVSGLFRATLAGLLLDLCNHGILMVGMKLYERGASIGQVMAFLVASPWNSFSVTLILISLVGFELTLIFVFASLLVAWITGLIFDYLVTKQVLPDNPHSQQEMEKVPVMASISKLLKEASYHPVTLAKVWWQGLKEARMVLRWILLGIVIVTLIRAFVPDDSFSAYFGASLMGLFLTLVAATIIEVCSEGSVPIAADIVTRADAPGNGFVFLMAGAATDYTEIMSVKETTGSWKLSLFLPLITVPQIMVVGWLINIYS